MFETKANISVDVLYDDVRRLREDMREQWRFYEELRKKVNGLYKLDHHNTERPKVDIFSDNISAEIRHLQTNVWGLQEKVEKLEKKK